MPFRLRKLLSRLNPNRSLRARAGLATVGIILLLSLLLSLIVGNISRDRISRGRGELLANLAYQMADKLDRSMFERYRDVEIIATTDSLHQSTVSLESTRDMLNRAQSTYQDYAWIGLVSPEGKVLVSTGQLLEGANVAERPWFKEALKGPFVGDVHEALLLAKLLPHSSNEPLRFVDIATPVMDEQNRLVGVLGAHLSWSWAEEIKRSLLDSLHQQSQIEGLIVSRKGEVLLGPADIEGEKISLKQLESQIPKGASSTISGYANTTFSNGVRYLVGFAPGKGYRNYPGLGWTVVIRQPTLEAFATARFLQQQVLIWGTLLGGLCAMGSWLYARRIVNSLLKLTTAVNRIRKGDVFATIPVVKGQDELAVFSGSLRYLVDTLDSQKKNLAEANQKLQQEIDERQNMSEQLKEKAALLDIATDAIFVRDLEGNIRFWNRGAEHVYGWSAKEACGKNAAAMLRGPSADKLQKVLKSVLETGEWQGELEKKTKAGKEILVASRWTLVRQDNSTPAAILTVDTDITETKQLEALFLRAQRLESLGTLASGIAHDLNNVLTPIVAAASLLPETLERIDPTSEELIAALSHSAKRAGDMVQQILSFARGTSGDRSLVQLSHVLNELQRVMESTFPKNITFNIHLPKDLWLVSADATQMHQVFMNLCVNARDAMPEGGTLTLKAKNMDLDEHDSRLHPDARVGAYVVATVTDTGIGMPPEVIDRVFDPFFTTKAAGKGTGLGLSTVIGIVKSHGGFIQVYSQPQQGTKFQVYLPAETNGQSPAASAAQAPKGHGELILVVDDEVLIQEITKTALESHGYRVITASDGAEAIARYRQYHPQIRAVLMDLMMPGVDGAEAIETLVSINPQVQIVVTSGLVLEAAAANVKMFLPKPYTIAEMLGVLDQLLSDQQSFTNNPS